MAEVIDALKSCFNNSKASAIIDFKNSIVTIGDKNKVDWESLEEDFFEIIRELPKESNELKSSKCAYEYIIKKDKDSLINLIKECSINFTSNLFSSAASAFLVDFIKKCL